MAIAEALPCAKTPALTVEASLLTMHSIECIFVAPTASITIRNLDEQTKTRLRVRAAQRSMEQARSILRAAVLAGEAATSSNLAEGIRRRFQPFGSVDLPVPLREPIRDPPEPGKGYSAGKAVPASASPSSRIG